MAAAKSACKEKKLAKMSSDLMSVWKGIKHMVRLNYDSSSATFGYPLADGKSRLANDLNEFHVCFEESASIADVASDDFNFEDISLDEIYKQFLRCKV